jgi:hypothetical protein
VFTHPLIQSVVSYIGFMFEAPAVTGSLFVDNAPSLVEVAVAESQNYAMESRFYAGAINRSFGIDDVGFEVGPRWSVTGLHPDPAPGSAQFDQFGDFA